MWEGAVHKSLIPRSLSPSSFFYLFIYLFLQAIHSGSILNERWSAPTFYTTTVGMSMRFTAALRHLAWRNIQWLHCRPPRLLMHNLTPNLCPFEVRSCHCHVPKRPTHHNWQQYGPQSYLYLYLLGKLLWLLVKKVGHLYYIRWLPIWSTHFTTGFLGLFKHEEDGEQVPPSIKRKLLKAQRALRNEDYRGAERVYHDALELLAHSKYASAQPYLEARAVTLDKMANMYLERNQLEEVGGEWGLHCSVPY